MGSYITKSRDKLYRPFAFPAPSPSYDHYMTGLEWVMTKDYWVPIYRQRVNLSAPTVLFSHGNGCDLGHTRPIIHQLSRELGVNVISYDYPGYGLMQGETTEQGCYNTIQYVYDYLVKTEKITNIVLMGQSVGTGPTAWLAKSLCDKKTPPRGVVLLCPFQSAISIISPSMATVTYTSHAVSETTLDIFDSYHHLKSVTCPVQLITGTADTVTPPSEALGLQKVLRNPLPLVSLEGAGHNDVFNPQFRDPLYSALKSVIHPTSGKV